MQDTWGENLWTKNGRQVALTGCSRSSETRTQWIHVTAATDRKVPARMKTMARWTIWFWVKRISPELTAESVKYYGKQAFLSHMSASYDRIFSWNALRGDMRKSFLRRTALLESYFWRSFTSFPRTSSSLQMKKCSLWLQRWKDCENRLRFRRVKANKIKRILRAKCNFHEIWTSNFPRYCRNILQMLYVFCSKFHIRSSSEEFWRYVKVWPRYI